MMASIAIGLCAAGYVMLIVGILRMFKHTDEADE